MIKELSIVVPCYNEEDCIFTSISKIKRYCKKNIKKYEIIVVDDGSTDTTCIILEICFPEIVILKNKRNYGKGYSVNKGITHAKYKWVLFTDADLSTPITELKKLYKHTKDDWDIIFGSRNVPGSKRIINQNLFRVLAGRIFPLLVNNILNLHYKDTQCGFKLFKKKTTEKIFKLQQINGFAFDVELLYLARINWLNCKEVGVLWVNSLNSKVHIIRDSINMFFELLKIKEIHG